MELLDPNMVPQANQRSRHKGRRPCPQGLEDWVGDSQLHVWIMDFSELRIWLHKLNPWQWWWRRRRHVQMHHVYHMYLCGHMGLQTVYINATNGYDIRANILQVTCRHAASWMGCWLSSSAWFDWNYCAIQICLYYHMIDWYEQLHFLKDQLGRHMTCIGWS